MTQGYYTGSLTNDIMASADNFGGADINNINDERLNKTPISITTYGALILPYDIKLAEKENKPDTDPKDTTKKEGKIKSALKRAGSATKNAITHPSQSIKSLVKYMSDKRNIDKLGSTFGVIGDKFSGIAVAQAIMDGKVTSREALDYLFMGFAPALGVTGSIFGYSGLMQMKEALSNGRIDVGGFIYGFRTTLKGIVDLKDMITKDNVQKSANVLEFDLTISHSETYQSETPDRRVQSGQSLNEYVHNMPITFEVQCALQEGKRYSKAEFRAILEDLRLRKETVSLILGDEIFDNLILTNFNPSHDCSKSGMDYTLSFKRITRSDITTDKEVSIQKIPTAYIEKDMNTGALGGGSSSKSSNGKDLVNGGMTSDQALSEYKKTYTKGKNFIKKVVEKERKQTIGYTVLYDK